MHVRDKIKAEISTARDRADMARSQGLRWIVDFEGIKIDATSLAYMSEHAAERWIQSCLRKVGRDHDIHGPRRQALRKQLNDFWSGIS